MSELREILDSPVAAASRWQQRYTIAALFFFHYLSRGSVADALAHAASSVFSLLRRTLRAGASEIVLIAAQDELVTPTDLFAPVAIGL